MKKDRFENFQPRVNQIYGNCTVLSPRGNKMFLCLEKKANWYLKRNLAIIIQESPLVIQLTFEPKKEGWYGDDYYLSEKHNMCVCCGDEELSVLTRHHIVPYMYRKCMPIEVKQSSSFDIAPLCLEHHLEYERHADKLKHELSKKYNAPFHDKMTEEQKAIKKLKSYAHITLNYFDKLPTEKQVEFKQTLRDYFGTDNYTEEQLREVAAFKIKREDAESAHAKIVMPQIVDLQEFVEMWRMHFIEHAQPEYMPKGWDPKRSIYRQH